MGGHGGAMKSGIWAAQALGARNDHFQYQMMRQDPPGYADKMRASNGKDLGKWPPVRPANAKSKKRPANAKSKKKARIQAVQHPALT